MQIHDDYENSSWANSSELTLGDTTPPILHTQSISATSGAINTVVTIGINVTEANDLNYVYIEIINPNDVKQNLTMSLSANGGVEHYYTRAYTPLVVGTYTFRFYAQDGSGYDAIPFDGISNYAATSAEEGGGGGGITIIDKCGNGICDPTETIDSCPIDCILTFYTTNLKTSYKATNNTINTWTFSITNDGSFDKQITVSVDKKDNIKFLTSNGYQYEYSFELPKKSGLQSGVKTITWQLDLTNTTMQLKNYTYEFTISDNLNSITNVVNIDVVDKKAINVFVYIIPAIIILIFIVVLIPTFLK